MISGKKAEKLERCFDGEMRGRLPFCPRCGKGKLKLVCAPAEMVSNRDGSANTIMCPGYFDEEGGFRVSCTFKAPVDSSEIKRKKWRSPDDPESDDDDDDEDADNGTSDGEFAAYADLSSDGSEGRKKAVAVLLDWSEKHSLRMPADSTARKVAVGTILMNHMSGSTFDLKGAAKALRKEFPSAAAEAEKRAEGPKCAVPANSDLADMFALIADLCKKANKNIFKTRANAKVAVLLRDVPYEIKLEHLKGKHAIQKKGPNKIEGFGKGSADAVKELLTLRDAGNFTSLDQISEVKKLRELLGQETDGGEDGNEFAGMY